MCQLKYKLSITTENNFLSEYISVVYKYIEILSELLEKTME